MSLAKLLEDTAQILADHDEALERLHSAAGGGRGSEVSYGALGPPSKREVFSPSIRLASLPGPSHRQLLQRFANAGAAKRREMLDQEGLRLFSIVFALYRPGPAFLPGHTLSPEALAAKVAPGGITWGERLAGLVHSPPPFDTRLANLARQCPRLDTYQDTMTGSGFLLHDGRIMTAGHVVRVLGWVSGGPPRPARVRYNQVNTAVPAEANITATRHLPGDGGSLDMAIVDQETGWRALLADSPLHAEFGVLAGVQLQTEPLREDELRNRPVAVIGHPISGNAGGDPADTQIVYGDAGLGLKRFMPGSIDGDAPIVTEEGQTLLCHNCSTLGGASGGCLIDLLTGRALGIHVAGNSSLGNRAVPIWMLPGISPQAATGD